jgi:hypothetical protein
MSMVDCFWLVSFSRMILFVLWQSESLTQHKRCDETKTQLLEYSPSLSQQMFSMSEWLKMDSMMSLGIKAFVDSQALKTQTVKESPQTSSTPEGAIQALACVLSVPMASRAAFGNDKSIFSGMSSLALESLLKELVSGMQSKTFEVAASALQVLGHWTSSKQGQSFCIEFISALRD